MSETLTPQAVTGADIAFGGDTARLLPAWGSIPEEFKRGHTKWNDIVSGWFFRGLKRPYPFVPKDGIDETAALQHLQACLGSFAPKHEHKEAGCAYLLSLWFELRG